MEIAPIRGDCGKIPRDMAEFLVAGHVSRKLGEPADAVADTHGIYLRLPVKGSMERENLRSDLTPNGAQS